MQLTLGSAALVELVVAGLPFRVVGEWEWGWKWLILMLIARNAADLGRIARENKYLTGWHGGGGKGGED